MKTLWDFVGKPIEEEEDPPSSLVTKTETLLRNRDDSRKGVRHRFQVGDHVLVRAHISMLDAEFQIEPRMLRQKYLPELRGRVVEITALSDSHGLCYQILAHVREGSITVWVDPSEIHETVPWPEA